MRSLLPLLFLLLSLSLASASAQGARTSVDVTYVNGELSLAGTLLLPSGDGPFPGAVIVHGSGTSSRSNPWTSAYADALVARGIAVLHPDKRGSGDSGGDWRTASFFDLADDARAGVKVLRDHDRVDPDRVGVIGFSQGGHIVPIVAATSPDLAFVVDVSGSVVPILEQIGDELRMEAGRSGFTESEVADLLAVHNRGVRYIQTGDGWGAYAEALSILQSGPRGESDLVIGFPSEQASPAWDFLRAIGTFDPMPYWHQVSAPTLFLYGGRDENVDVFKSARRIEEQLTASGLPYSLLLFRNNGHALYREDAMDFVARWIHDGGVD